jgi:chorismate synthase
VTTSPSAAASGVPHDDLASRTKMVEPTAGDDEVVIRRLESTAEFAECVRLQRLVWGADFAEIVPPAILRVAQYVGGVTAGAFDAAGTLVGFVFGITGIRDGRLVHWSDMLAVHPDRRGSGLGVRLKLAQRELLRPLGVRTMLWTYDPLVARNAHINLNVLGGRVAEYVRDAYGTETGSALHGGIGTDRFLVEWDLADESRPAPSASEPGDAPVVNPPNEAGVPSVPATFPATPDVRVAIPDDIHAVLRAARDAARAWRETTRAALVWYLAHGYAVGALRRDRAAGLAYYTLTRLPASNR